MKQYLAEIALVLSSSLLFHTESRVAFGFSPRTGVSATSSALSTPKDCVRFRGYSLRTLRETRVILYQNEKFSEEKISDDDTVRVRIWRTLVAAGNAGISLTELSKAVGGERKKDVLFHLKHVERQAKTIANKSLAWKTRRGLLLEEDGDESKAKNISKATIQKQRKGKDIYIRLIF